VQMADGTWWSGKRPSTVKSDVHLRGHRANCPINSGRRRVVGHAIKFFEGYFWHIAERRSQLLLYSVATISRIITSDERIDVFINPNSTSNLGYKRCISQYTQQLIIHMS
jgi:hypothetical protein